MTWKRCHPYAELFYCAAEAIRCRRGILYAGFFLVIYSEYLQSYNLPDFRMHLGAGKGQGTWSDMAGNA